MEKNENQAPEAVAKDIQNGVTRPKPGTTTGRVWQIADEQSAKLGAPAPRKDVLAVATAEDINVATAATQYGKWRKYHGLAAEPKAPKAAPAEKDAGNSEVETGSDAE